MPKINQKHLMVWTFFLFLNPTELYAALNLVLIDIANRMLRVLKERCVEAASMLLSLLFSYILPRKPYRGPYADSCLSMS